MSFACPICSRVSHNPRDEAERYCGVCGFVDEPFDKEGRPRTMRKGPPPPPAVPVDQADYNEGVHTSRRQAARLHGAYLAAGARPFWALKEAPPLPDGERYGVAHLWVALPTLRPTGWGVRASTWDELRALLPAGLHLGIGPYPEPDIVETWA